MLRKSVMLAAVIVCIGSAPALAAAAGAWSPASTITDKRINESSSLAISARFAGTAYTANDEPKPVIYAVDIASGRVVGKTQLKNTKFRDPEAMAIDGQGTVWLADAGDNRQRYHGAALYAFPEQGSTNSKIVATRFPIAYSDGLAHNVETFMVNPVTGAKYLVAKTAKGSSEVFALPATLQVNSVNVATVIGSVAPRNVSDGAISPNGAWVVIRDVKNLYVFSSGLGSLVQTVVGPPVRKGESIAFNPSGSALLLGSEGKRSPLFWMGFNQTAGRIATR